MLLIDRVRRFASCVVILVCGLTAVTGCVTPPPPPSPFKPYQGSWVTTTDEGFQPVSAPEDDSGDGPPVPGPGVSPRYRSPASVFGNPWGTPLTTLEARYIGLRLLAAQTVEWTPRQTDIHGECIEFTNYGGCKNFSFSSWTEGGGIEAYAEYYSPYLGYRDDETGAFYYPVIFQVCASYGGSIQKTLHQDLQLCGVRLGYYSHHDTDTDPNTLGEQVLHSFGANLPQEPDSLHNDERVLKAVFRDFGYPPGYKRPGEITVVSPDGTQLPPEQKPPPVLDYRYCGVNNAFDPIGCKASVTLVYNPQEEWGFVEFAAPPLYRYADASYQMGDVDNRMFNILHGIPLRHHQHQGITVQRGSLGQTCLECRPEMHGMAKKVIDMFQPRSMHTAMNFRGQANTP